MYRRPGSDPCDPKFTCKTVKFPDKVMVWGAFSYYGVGELIVLPKNETMNKERYLELIADHLYICFEKCKINPDNGIFMQDGASCHTANIIKDYLAFVGIDYIKDYPGNSPNISPIENLWAIMKAKPKDTSTVPKLISERT